MKKTLKSKKSILIAAVMILLIIIVAIVLMLTADKGYRNISITDIVGNVIAENNGNSYAAYKNMNIEGGYQLKTDSDSHTFMLLDEDKYVKLEEESHAVFEDLGSNKVRNTVIRVEKGTLTSEIVRPLSTEESYIVNTPNAVLAVRGTYFKVCVSKDKNGDYYTDVYTYGGTVACRRVMPDGTIVDEEVLIPEGYKARVKMDEVITIYVEELIEEEEDKVDPIELREVGDNDLVGIYNASIHGHKMFRDSETLWIEIEDRGIDVSKHRSPYDNKPVERFDKNRHGNGGKHDGGNGHKHDIDVSRTDVTTADFEENEQNTENTTTERENEISTVSEETQITANGVVDGENYTQSSIVTTRPNVGGLPFVPVTGPVSVPAITTVPVSETEEVTTVIPAETDETTTETELDEGTETTNEAEITENSDEATITTTMTTTNAPVVTGPSWVNTGAIGTTAPTSATEETTAPVTEETTTTEAHVCEFEDYISDNNATCTEDGTKTAECECGKTDTITDIGSATGHTEKTETTDPTCAEAGKTVVSCEVCGETISEEEIAALGHTEKTETTDPDCTNAGKTVVSCEVCGETISEEEIAALGHTEVEETVEATFAAEGLYTKSCSVCGETLETEVLERLPALYTEDGDITITATGYTQGDAAEETPFTGDYVISQRDSSVAVDCAIAINSGTHNVTLDGVNINGTDTYDYVNYYTLCVSGNVKFSLNGNNTFHAPSYYSIMNHGVVEFNGGVLNIFSDNAVEGTMYNSNTIKFNTEMTNISSSEFAINNSGTILFIDGKYDIKGLVGIYGGNVELNGGNVVCSGSYDAAVSWCDIRISQGSLTAKSSFDSIVQSDIVITGGSLKCNVDDYSSAVLDITNGTDELECIVFDTFPTEAQRTFINSDGTSYVYALTEEDKADDGKYYVWKPVGMIAINEVNFPDYVFRENIVASIDRSNDNDGYLSVPEANSVTQLSPNARNYGRAVTSLKGIEYFTKLERLDISGNANGFTEFDISKNTALTYLDCSDSGITSLDVSKNTALTYLDCSYTYITSLDLSSNTALTDLNCAVTYIISLDVSKNPALTNLNCYYIDAITSLDVSKNTALTSLDCSDTGITSLDVSNNTALQTLSCYSTGITELDISNNTALKELICYSTDITSLDISKNNALEKLDCMRTAITSLDASNNTDLIYLRCDETKITSLDLNNNVSLSKLYFSGTDITSIDISNNVALTYLACADAKLTSLDVSNNTALKSLRCQRSTLACLDVTNNVSLTDFIAEYNKYVIPTAAVTFDTSTITGFDPTKVSNVTNADFDSTTGIFTNITGDITYTYDCGQGYSETFTLTRTG